MNELTEGESGICENCGSPATAQVDPFNAEMNMDYDLHMLCDDCAQQSAMGV